MKKFSSILCTLLTLFSCGKPSGSGDPDTQTAEIQEEQTEGIFEARLGPLNMEQTGSTVGDFRVRILGDEIRIRGEVKNSPPTVHRQALHLREDCPGPGADQDLDGKINFEESLRITGPRLASLNHNLDSRGGNYPLPGAMGNYTYFATGSYSQVLGNLSTLQGKTIVIYGVPGDPDLPIACGTLFRMGDP